MSSPRVAKMLEVNADRIGNLTPEETAELAAGAMNIGTVNRGTVFAFLDALEPEDRMEFIAQAEQYAEEHQDE